MLPLVIGAAAIVGAALGLAKSKSTDGNAVDTPSSITGSWMGDTGVWIAGMIIVSIIGWMIFKRWAK